MYLCDANRCILGSLNLGFRKLGLRFSKLVQVPSKFTLLKFVETCRDQCQGRTLRWPSVELLRLDRLDAAFELMLDPLGIKGYEAHLA